MFETARGFLKLEWYDVGEAPQHVAAQESQFYHLPYLNQLSWAATVTKMALDTDPVNVRAARANGNIALRFSPDGLRVFQQNLVAFPAYNMDNNPRIFADGDKRRTCSYTVYEIVESDRTVQDSFE